MGVLFLLCHYPENAMAAGTTTSRVNRTVDSDEIFQVDLLKSGNEKTRTPINFPIKKRVSLNSRSKKPEFK